ncbi:MAG TPA: Hsp70 family protein [Pseudonocardiaceae bacterium]|nr:Hsp70 family protein [Pseudonocardiaceae bacterium]
MADAKVPFGIDLGTTHSVIAHVDDSGQSVVLKSEIGEDTTPSVVYFEGPGQVLVGTTAKNSAILAPHLVAQLVKRDMGKPGIKYPFHGREYTPDEISSLILRELVRAVAKNEQLTVQDVVITVPAYFGVAEREATSRAGDIAGLNVLEVLDEPVAAALHYQALYPEARPRTLLVCDLGGGTYDTTVIRVRDKDIRAVCTHGDPALGGADWDVRVRDHLLAAFHEQHPRLDPTADEMFMQDLAITAEQLKKRLSEAVTGRTDLRFAGSVARVELTRDHLSELTSDLLDRVVRVTEHTLELARGKGIDRFDDVILVGGMSRVPAVGARVAELVGQQPRLHEPELAVAKGAALFAMIRRAKTDRAAGMTARHSAERVADRTGMTTEQVMAMADTTVTTVVPRAFGVLSLDANDPLALTDPAAARKIVVHLLSANTPLPADTGPYTFQTPMANQRMAGIEIWEQAGIVESPELAHNKRIGGGILRGLPPRRPPGAPVEITFFLSDTGTLTVHATEPNSGAELRFDLDIGGMAQVDVAAARRDMAAHKVSG